MAIRYALNQRLEFVRRADNQDPDWTVTEAGEWRPGNNWQLDLGKFCNQINTCIFSQKSTFFYLDTVRNKLLSHKVIQLAKTKSDPNAVLWILIPNSTDSFRVKINKLIKIWSKVNNYSGNLLFFNASSVLAASLDFRKQVNFLSEFITAALPWSNFERAQSHIHNFMFCSVTSV